MKELRAAEDDDDEAERIEELGDELGFGARCRGWRGRWRLPRAGKAHEDAAGEAREGEGDGGAFELFAGVLGDLLEDLLGAGAGKVLLRGGWFVGLLGLFAAEADGHAWTFRSTSCRKLRAQR